MKKALLSLALVIALASCSAPTTPAEGKVLAADTTIVVSTTDSMTVGTTTAVVVDTVKAAATK